MTYFSPTSWLKRKAKQSFQIQILRQKIQNSRKSVLLHSNICYMDPRGEKILSFKVSFPSNYHQIIKFKYDVYFYQFNHNLFRQNFKKSNKFYQKLNILSDICIISQQLLHSNFQYFCFYIQSRLIFLFLPTKIHKK